MFEEKDVLDKMNFTANILTILWMYHGMNVHSNICTQQSK